MLPDGRLIVEGGEYCDQDQNPCDPDNQGAIFDSTKPPEQAWTSVMAPTNWYKISGSSSVVLPSGVYMQADPLDSAMKWTALLNRDLSWTCCSSTNAPLGETGWTLLTNNQVLMVESHSEQNMCYSDPSHLGYELYDYNSNQWTCNGGTPPHTSPQNVAQGYHTNEIGAAVMMYNGYVLQFGADDTNPSTALYKVGGDWKAGPVPPFASPPNDSLHLIQTDGPAVLEPNGKVLALMSPWLCNQHPDCMGSCDPTLQCGAPGPCDAVEYTPSSDGSGIGIFNLQTKPNMCTIGNSSLPGHMLLLPNGQIMLAYYATELELFTPDLNLSDWPKVAPHIISTGPLTLKKGQPTAIIGTQFNGLSQANMYGDDFQDATNFPIAQLSTGSDCQHLLPVALVPTGNDFGNPISNPPNSIQPNNETGTYVTVPQSQNTGSYWLSVITNGIPSDNCIWVTVVP